MGGLFLAISLPSFARIGLECPRIQDEPSEMDLMDAEWWNPAAPQDRKPIVRQAPDDGQYHLPDSRMLDKMGGSPVGRFAIVPRARNDGGSSGFNCQTAGTVHVDPDAPDGGVVVDCQQLNKQAVDTAQASSYFPHQVFYQLGTPARLLGIDKNGRTYTDYYGQPGFSGHSSYELPAQGDYGHGYGHRLVARDNPHLPPGAYLTPTARGDGRQWEESQDTVRSMASPMYRVQEEQRVNPVPPLNMLQPTQAPPPQAAPAPVPAPAPAYAPQQQVPPGYYPPQQPYQQYQPPPMDPNMMALMQQMANGINALSQRLSQPPPAPPPQPAPPPAANPLTTAPRLRGVPQQPQYNYGYPNDGVAVPAGNDGGVFDDSYQPTPVKRPKRNHQQPPPEDDDQPQRLTTFQQKQAQAQEQDDPRTGVITGFETLNLPWLNGPMGNKPKRQVFFEIPNAGKHSARYHDVVESDYCVMLVYDTRYEEGHQYLPPDMSQHEHSITLHVPHMKKVFQVASMGFAVSFGVFDMLIMPKQGVETADEGK